jgi:hypothetical protein
MACTDDAGICDAEQLGPRCRLEANVTMREHIEPLNEKPERKLLRPAMPGAGRPLGAINKFTRELKTALLDAAILSDFAKDPSGDEDAPHSLTNYCLAMVHKYPELYFQALMRLVPKEINTHLQQDTTIDVTLCRTTDDVKRDMKNLGMSQREIEQIENILLPKPVDEEAHDDAADILFDRDRS